MPPAPTAPPAPASSSSGLAAWLRTREGRITAGVGAALLVVVVALARRGRGDSGAAPFTAEGLQGGPDTTLQDRLDQLGLRGGTIEELIGSTSDLSSGLADLTGRIDQLTDTPTGGASAAKIAELVHFNSVKANYQRAFDALTAQRPGIVSRLGSDAKARGQLAALDQRRTQLGKSLSIVTQQIAARST
jgi:hypothetical protein